MRKILVALAAVLALAAAGCSCAAEKNAVAQIERTHEIVLPQYLGYVAKDPGLDPAARDDRTKLIDSLKRLVEKLKKSLEE